MTSNKSNTLNRSSALNSVLAFIFSIALLSGCDDNSEDSESGISFNSSESSESSSSPVDGSSFERDFDISLFSSSKLPLMIIENQGVEILDEPKILTKILLINNAGANNLNDTTNLDYGFDADNLFAGIEIRGASSAKFAKKQYGLELWKTDEDITSGVSLADYPIGSTEDLLKDEDVLDDQASSLLSMPKEEDWIINAPFVGKTLMRNYFAYGLAADMTNQWQPKAKFIELLLKNVGELDYRGVYLLIEKIKRDSNRVDINKLKDDEISGEDLTGGYIIEMTSPNRVDEGEQYFPVDNRVFVINYPKSEDLQPEQFNYIKDYTNDFINALYGNDSEDETIGYSAYVDMDSLVDFFLFNQLLKNKDAFTLSTYFHKDKNGLLVAGPLWDFNLTAGNGNLSNKTSYDPSNSYKFWSYTSRLIAEELFESPKFVALYKLRWTALRVNILSDAAILIRIDDATALLTNGPAERNYEKWDVFGRYLQGNELIQSQSHAEEVAHFRQWMLNRMAWIDDNIDEL